MGPLMQYSADRAGGSYGGDDPSRKGVLEHLELLGTSLWWYSVLWMGGGLRKARMGGLG